MDGLDGWIEKNMVGWIKNRWMVGWIENRWMVGWIQNFFGFKDRWMDRNGQKHGWMEEMDGRMDMDGWMDRKNRWMVGWI